MAGKMGTVPACLNSVQFGTFLLESLYFFFLEQVWAAGTASGTRRGPSEPGASAPGAGGALQHRQDDRGSRETAAFASLTETLRASFQIWSHAELSLTSMGLLSK